MNPKTGLKVTQGLGPQALEPQRKTTLISLALGLLLSALTAWGQPVLHPTFPKDVLVSSGEKRVPFTVQATSSTGSLEYRWFHDQNEIHGATNTSLILTNFQAIDVGSYHALVTDASGLWATSRVAKVTVGPFARVLGEALGDDRFLRTTTDLAWPQWVDYDNDGWLEMVVSRGWNSSAFNEVYESNRDGTFRQTTNRLTTVRGRWERQVWADYDADGDLDCIIIEYPPTAPSLFLNQSSEGISDFTCARQPWPKGIAGSLADYDLDGWIDFANAHWNGMGGSVGKNYLVHNEAGQFTVVTNTPYALSGVGIELGYWVDYDGDADPDFFGATSGSQLDLLFRNDGNGVLVRVTNELSNVSATTVMAGWGDYDNDGDLDVVLPHLWEGPSFLYRNQGTGVFEKDAGFSLNISETPFNPSWGDYDNDGDLDLCVTHDSGNCRLFNNDGTGKLTPFMRQVSTNIVVGGPTREYHVFYGSWADYDNDGWLDLLAQRFEQGSASALFRNNLRQMGNQNHWLKVQLRGIVSNPNGLHANIRLKASIGGTTVWQLRTIGLSCYATDLMAHFGLGDATQVDTLRIEWPSGIVQDLSNVPVDQFLTVTEARNQPGPPPVVTAYGRAANGAFNATVTFEEPGVRAVLQASTDMVHWAKVMMRTNVTGTIQFTDAPATPARPMRFYRVVVP